MIPIPSEGIEEMRIMAPAILVQCAKLEDLS